MTHPNNAALAPADAARDLVDRCGADLARRTVRWYLDECRSDPHAVRKFWERVWALLPK